MRNTAYGDYATDVRIAFFGEAGFGWRRFEELGLAPVPGHGRQAAGTTPFTISRWTRPPRPSRVRGAPGA
ncbi:MAG TPA: hypothetical protein VIV59_04475, partial [Anaeromyxobacteraceae bacterium]